MIVSRCEVDLKKVCSEYKAHFGQSLQKAIMVNNNLWLGLLIFFFFFILTSCNQTVYLPYFYRNTPKETTRRLRSACVDPKNKLAESQSLSFGGNVQKKGGLMEKKLILLFGIYFNTRRQKSF